MKLFLLALVATAYALPSPDMTVPETELVSNLFDPIKEAQDTVTNLLQSGKDAGACADLAASAVQEVEDAVSAQQKVLASLDTGADCHTKGQSAVDAAQETLTQANKDKEDADTAAASATSADVAFAPKPLSSLTPNQCDQFFSDPAYTAAVAAKEAATGSATKAEGAVTAAQSGLKAAQDAQAEAIKECQCSAKNAYEKAWEAANANNDADAKAYTKGKHMKCVLEGTPANECQVGEIPKVQAITLADDVQNAECPEEEAPQENNEENNEPIVPKCQCNEEAPAFMQVDTQAGTDWITSYKVNTPVNGGSLIPHPGGVIKMAWRCGSLCNYPESFWKEAFNDGNLYQVTKINSVTEVSEDTAVLWDILPGVAHTAAEVQFLEAFLERGGRLIMTGEHSGFATQNNIVSATVKALGGGISVNADAHSKDILAGHINNLQVNGGLTFIKPNYWASLKVDKSVTEVLCTSDQDKIFVADQMLKKGRVTIWADINIFQYPKENGDFFKNLVHQGMNFVKAVKKGGNPNEAGPCQC
jgi:hypothetical protein